VPIGHWTWPYTLTPQTLGEPIAYRYTNLKTYAHTHSTKHTHTPFTHHQTRCPPSSRSEGRCRLHLPQNTHNTHQRPIHPQARIHVGRTQYPPPHPQLHLALPHAWPIQEEWPHGR
jgi:hypothetical protein